VAFKLKGHYICLPCDVKLLREDGHIRPTHAVIVYVSKYNIASAHLLYIYIYIYIYY